MGLEEYVPPFPRNLGGRGVTSGAPLTGRGKRKVGVDQWRPLAHRGQHIGETMLEWPKVPVSETATLRYLCGPLIHVELEKHL